MSVQSKLLCFVSIFVTSVSSAEQCWSQELKKVRADYFSGPIQYSPDDPWVRSKVFQTHTGHSGYFYNCDDEECKRNSPYIKWTTNCEPQWPKRRGLLNGLRSDLDKIRWRIAGGSCECGECSEGRCANCENSMSESIMSSTNSDSKFPSAPVPKEPFDEHRIQRQGEK